MYRLQIMYCGEWKWGIREYASLDAAKERIRELKKVGIKARARAAAELFN